MSDSVEKDELIARFVLSNKQIRSKDNSVKHTAFMPPKNNPELSVYRISGLRWEEVKKIGDKYVAKARGKNLKGRGDLLAAHYYDNKLNIVPNYDPHPKHANAIGWPNNWDEVRAIADELARNASLDRY